MRIAQIITDNREAFRQYEKAEPWFGTAPEALLQGLAMMPDIEVHVISCTQRPMPAPEKLANNIWFHSLQVKKSGWLRTGYQGCIRAVRREVKRLRPDVVHGQGTERDCSISAIFSGFPNVLTIHGNMRSVARLNHAKPFSFLWLAAKLESFAIPRTDGVICITNYTHEFVKRLARKTWVVPNAVDSSFFEVQSTLPTDLAAPAVGLCVGTICHRKNQNAFIRALDPLAAQKNFKIVFLGGILERVYGKDFMQLVKERSWCEYAGWAGRDELRRYFSHAAFLVLPSLEDNCPMVVLEAMAAGVPILASNIGGVPDLIEPNKTGLFCDPRQPETFRAGVARLLEDRDLARQLTRQAKYQALQRFDPLIIAQQHMEIYRELLRKD